MGPILIPEFSDFQVNPGHDTLQMQLYHQCVDRIQRGIWPPGARLPATRRCAQTLGISRNTITATFSQLVAEGFLVSRQGSGFFVHEELPQSLAIESPPNSTQCIESPLPQLSGYGKKLDANKRSSTLAMLPFTVGVPDLRAFPSDIWSRIERRNQQRHDLLGFEDFQGHAQLRSAVATYLRASRHVNCTAENVLITQGAQQAITLCAQVLLEADDKILIENPGYSRARQAFAGQQVDISTLAVDSSGLNASQLPATSPAKLMYTTPTHQYPLGGIMPAAERLKLLEWARNNQTWIIEDDYDSEFHFYDKPVAALQGMTQNSPVIYMGSFSKTLFPALRLGYLVLPTPLIGAFTGAKSSVDGESPLVAQATTAQFMLEGHFQRHIRRMRVNYRKKWEHMMALVEQHLGSTFSIVAESAGMHVALVNNSIDDVALARELNDAGIGGSALSSYYAGKPLLHGLVLGFANSTARQRENGIQYISKLM
jgi:GntR family transcriptional regulator/MocR family aminotransferase